MRNFKLINLVIGLLLLQFVLGILATLYSTIPSQNPGEVFHHFNIIVLHGITGTLLIILGIVYLIKVKGKAEFKYALSGLINMLLAYGFGELFVFKQNNVFSFLMALAFIGSLMSYTKISNSLL